MARACTGLPLQDERVSLAGRSMGMVVSSVRVVPFCGSVMKRSAGSPPDEQSLLTKFIAAMRVSLLEKTSRLEVSSERATPTAGRCGFAFCAAAPSGTDATRLRQSRILRMGKFPNCLFASPDGHGEGVAFDETELGIDVDGERIAAEIVAVCLVIDAER